MTYDVYVFFGNRITSIFEYANMKSAIDKWISVNEKGSQYDITAIMRMNPRKDVPYATLRT